MARSPPKPKPAKVKPASGREPASENTQGIVTPKTAPNTSGAPTNPPVKAETAQEKSLLEKAGELLDKGEIGVLNRAKEGIQGGIDAAVSAAGGGMVAGAIGAIGKGTMEIFFPTNVIDVIPGAKILSGGKKAAKLGEAALKAAGKEAAEKVAKEAAEKAAKEAAEKAVEKEAKKAAGSGGAYAKGKKKKKNPCDHPNDAKKKKYVVYKADELDGAGNKVGTYVGRTSGQPGESVRQILNRRLSGHKRNLGQLQEEFTTDSYSGVRGAEQIVRDRDSTVKQINPVSPKNKRRLDYLDCAKLKGVK